MSVSVSLSIRHNAHSVNFKCLHTITTVIVIAESIYIQFDNYRCRSLVCSGNSLHTNFDLYEHSLESVSVHNINNSQIHKL